MPNEDGYVECAECGHLLEAHDKQGCGLRSDGCGCNESWTVRQIGEVRREAGLPVRFSRLDY